MKTTTRIMNRGLAAELPADGWFHLAPLGKFPALFEPSNNKPYKAVQIYDREAMGAMIANFTATKNREGASFRGVLLDEDHLSENPHGRTAAMGRIMDLELRESGDWPGLWCRIEFTPPGADSVRNRVYSFLSLDADVDLLGTDPVSGLPSGRPVELKSVALTNQPRLPVRAMNRDTQLQDEVVTSPGKQTDPATAGKTKEQATMDYKAMLLKLLGLDAAAPDGDIQAKCDAMTTEVENTKTKCSRLETENTELKLGKEADQFCDTNATRIKNRASVRAAYIKDPAGTKALFLEGITEAPSAERPRTLNGGQQPAEEQIRTRNRRAEQDAAVRGHMKANGITDYGLAQQQLSAAKPELFA